MSHAPSDNGRRDEERARPGLIERLRHVFGLQSPSIREELEDALDDEPRDAGDLSVQERAILRNVLALHEHRVRDIMIPRADIIAIAATASLADVLSLFRTAGHSRLPVHGDTLDDPRGMVHIRDLVDYLAGRAESAEQRRRDPAEPSATDEGERPRRARFLSTQMIDLSTTLLATGIIRPVLFIPPSMPALDLLVRMQATRTHMALVIDEYGGTDGLVSIEDVVEMVVGDIEDEHDDVEPIPVVRAGADAWIVDARADLADVLKETGWDIPEGERPEVDTIGGLVASIAGRVPTRGEIVVDRAARIEFEVLDADPRRVKSVRMRRVPEEETPPPGRTDTVPPAAET